MPYQYWEMKKNNQILKKKARKTVNHWIKCPFFDKISPSTNLLFVLFRVLILHVFQLRQLFSNTLEWVDTINSMAPVRCDCNLKSLMFILISSTVWCHFNMVNFLTYIHKRLPIARPLGRGMGVFCGSSIWLIFCLSSSKYLFNILKNIWPRYNGTRLYNPVTWTSP